METRPRSSQHLPSAQTWTRAKELQKGAQTPMLAWFATVAGEPGAADAERDVRGFALKSHKASEGRCKHQIMNRFDESICRVCVQRRSSPLTAPPILFQQLVCAD